MGDSGRSALAVRRYGLASRLAAGSPSHWLRLAATGLVLCTVPALAGCSASAGETASQFRGTVLAEAIDLPDFTLTDTDGSPFALRERAAGRLTLLFFGYTNCPDVCPVHMASLATVLARFPWDVRNRVAVVFVTTDPDRDTADRLRSWLDGFAPSFVGLRGDIREVNRLQSELGLAPAIPGPEVDGGYTVGHAAQVIAFSPDGKAHIVYPFGTRQADWLHDIPLLLEHSW